MLNRIMKNAWLALAALFLSSCGGGGSSGLNVYMTDAPVDLASSIIVSFAQITLDGPDVAKPQTLVFSPVRSMNLFQLQGGLSGPLVQQLPIASGHYTDLKLTISASSLAVQSSITLPDGTHVLYIPDGSPSTIDLPVDFTFNSGDNLDLTLDFDMRKSIVQDPEDSSKYILIPSIRAVLNNDTGLITGRVDTSLITCTTPAVYVYSGDVTPTDVDSNAPAGTVQPLATALVGLNTRAATTTSPPPSCRRVTTPWPSPARPRRTWPPRPTTSRSPLPPPPRSLPRIPCRWRCSNRLSGRSARTSGRNRPRRPAAMPPPGRTA